MNVDIGDATPVEPISVEHAHAMEWRVQEARRLFRRALASWASDLLILRSRGLRSIQWSAMPRREAA